MEQQLKEFDVGRRAPAEVSLTRLFDECAPGDPLAPYQDDMRQWATTYLTAPHPELGREGPVCPYTAPSIKKEMFWVGCVDQPDLTAPDIERTVADAITGFRSLSPTEGPNAVLKTILILFPAVTDYRLIEVAQKRLKDDSVAAGLMVGQFYPGCEEGGVRNPEFKALRSPLPLLAIRHMVGSDFPFMVGKVEWVEEYLTRFAPSIPAPVRNMIAAEFDVHPAKAS